MTPRRRVLGLTMIIRDPKPAVAQGLSLGRRDPRAIQHLVKTILAAIETWIPPSALADSFDEGDGLIDSHRAAWIMAILFEIEDEQNTVGLQRRSPPIRLHDT